MLVVYTELEELFVSVNFITFSFVKNVATDLVNFFQLPSWVNVVCVVVSCSIGHILQFIVVNNDVCCKFTNVIVQHCVFDCQASVGKLPVTVPGKLACSTRLLIDNIANRIGIISCSHPIECDECNGFFTIQWFVCRFKIDIFSQARNLSLYIFW